MAETKKAEEKKSSNTLLYVGIGCLVIIVILGVIGSLAFNFFAKKIGTGIVQKAIEEKTGVKTNIQDLEKGKMTFTDEKTGTSIDIGSNKIPSSFPSDFPLYPGMKLLSSMSGSEKSKGMGFWLTFTTPDSYEKVAAFYKTELPKAGYKETATYAQGDTSTTTITKSTYSGTVSVSRADSATETTVIIMLGQDSADTGSDASEE